MIELHLFRIKVYLPKQPNLFNVDISKKDVLRTILDSAPECELRKGHTWHIGNVNVIDDDSVYFAFGKTTLSKHSVYDDIRRDFIEKDYETSPYTHVFLDLKYQVLAIAKKTALGHNIKRIIGQLKKLLNGIYYIKTNGYQIEISEITDPNDFINSISTSYSVSRFFMDFGMPNPWDVDKDFQKPLERLAAESNAIKGNVSVFGDNLDKKLIKSIARSAASTGNKGFAELRQIKDGPKIRSYLRENPAIIRFKDISNSIFKDVISKIRSEYENLRQNQDG